MLKIFIFNKISKNTVFCNRENQLNSGGRLVIPVGNHMSSYNPHLSGDLMVVDKKKDGSIQTHKLFSCSFIPSQANDS